MKLPAWERRGMTSDETMVSMRIVLQTFDEPIQLRDSLNASRDHLVRKGVLGYGWDLVKPGYQLWKDQLRAGGLDHRDMQSAVSSNRGSWWRWLSGEITWRNALENLVEQLNERSSQERFMLS